MDKRIKYAFEYTKILRRPKQLISTFGSSNIHFYVLTEPVYSEFTKDKKETVVREGKVSWYQPKLFMPNYMFRIEGFSKEAKKAFETLSNEYPDLAGILYKFKVSKELDEMNFVSDTLLNVAENINQQIEKKGDSLSAIIKGVPGLWDVSLSKFILDMMARSAYLAQIPDFTQKGFLGLNQTGQTVVAKDRNGIPLIAKEEIEKLFNLVKNGELEPVRLKEELDKWGLFPQYQDR
ncbi:MAG: hypothetical protein U9N08_08740, partial [Candidatus Caldatribacteriota bacterium]|nr:hypothetical protein [Candidatus Caldatribacteriota bacterium]